MSGRNLRIRVARSSLVSRRSGARDGVGLEVCAVSLLDEVASIPGAISSWRFLRNWRWWLCSPLLLLSLTVMLPAFALLITGALCEGET
jgi:hypothetical protein